MGVAALKTVTILPLAAPIWATAGVDWAKDDHAVAVVDQTGRQTQRFTVAHSTAGLRELVRCMTHAPGGASPLSGPVPPGPRHREIWSISVTGRYLADR